MSCVFNFTALHCRVAIGEYQCGSSSVKSIYVSVGAVYCGSTAAYCKVDIGGSMSVVGAVYLTAVKSRDPCQWWEQLRPQASKAAPICPLPLLPSFQQLLHCIATNPTFLLKLKLFSSWCTASILQPTPTFLLKLFSTALCEPLPLLATYFMPTISKFTERQSALS